MHRMSPRLLRWLARWLVGAMLLATLAPAISRTLTASRQAGDWVELCTAQGMRWAQWSGQEADVGADLDQKLQQALDRCGHCSLTADRFAPLVPQQPEMDLLVGAWPVPGHRELALRSIAALNPSARGPPCS